MNNSNNNTQNITKILPLFGNPVLKKTKRDRMLNKYNININDIYILNISNLLK